MLEGTCEERTVVVTGAAQGLGLAIAARFARTGAHVTIADADVTSGQHAVEELASEGLRVRFHELDVRDPGQSAALVDKLARDRARIDVWVNSAGIAHRGAGEALSREQWDDSMAMILSGAFFCSQAAGRRMLAQGRGVIINVSSVSVYKASEGDVAYCVAHAGLIMRTQALGVEFAKRGVRVVGIAPGAVETNHTKKMLEIGLADIKTFERRTPPGSSRNIR